jgi:hypothetical protein
MFSKLFGKKDTTKTPKAPEIMGLYLGGSFQIDPLKLKLIEPSLIINAPASSHIMRFCRLF